MALGSYDHQHQVVNGTPQGSPLSLCRFLFHLYNPLELNGINHLFCYDENLMLVLTYNIPHINHIAQQELSLIKE